MKQKTCFKCGEIKSVSHFYKHSQMADGYLNKCKECAKADSSKNRQDNPEYYKEYDRKRADLPHRVELRAKIAENWKVNPKLRKKRNALQKQWQENNKEKRAAYILTSNAIRDGRLIKKPCEFCGKKKVEAHHDDYMKPLEVRWLCRKHHTEHHNKLREKERNE